MKIYFISFVSLFLLFSNINAQVWIEGHCFLENQIDHSGTQVIFEAVSPSASTDTTFTSIGGLFQLNLSPGIYNVNFSKDGYFSYDTIGVNLLNAFVFNNLLLLYKPQGITLPGIILDNFLSDTTYIIENDVITVSNLTIEAGATFYFNENASMAFGSQVTAIGTNSDSIKFLPYRNVQYWGHISVGFDSAGSSLEYCVFSGGSLNIGNSDILINHCTFENNILGIHLQNSNANISNSLIKNIYNYGILSQGGSPNIEYCTFYSDSMGFDIRDGTPIFKNNLLANIGYNIWFASNGSITYNNFYNHSDAYILGNIPPFFGQLMLVNNNGDSCDAYYNIFEDPLFVNAPQNNFNLFSNSPCIDAGDPNSPFDPDSTITDIGAFYFHQGPRPEISISHQNLDFGETVVNFDSTIYLDITNNGSLDLILTDIYTSDSTFTTDWSISDSIIASGNSLNVGITFSPANYIQYSEQLTIQNNDHPVQIRLYGVGIPPFGSFPTSLILTGGGADSANWNYFINNTQPSTNDAYTKLSTGRYYGDTRLFYMNPIAWQDLNGDTLDDGIVDADSITPETFHQSLLDLYDEPDTQFPNVIFLAGHGHVGEFDINGDVNDNVSIDTLANWINEAQLDQASPLVIIFEACFSGGYLPYLSAPDRIIITACRGDQFADYLNGESFSTHFWHEVWYGNNVWDSFNFAFNWSLANLNGQEAQLDADGNGIPNEASDQAIASNIFLGGQYMHGAGLPKIMDYPSNLQIVNSEVDVWAECNNMMDRVWFRIFPADYTGSPPVNQLPYVEMINVSGTRYEGTYYDNGFVQLGEDYEIQIGAVDDIFNYAVPRVVPLTVASLGLETNNNIPLKYYLNQSYPNPFNSNTTIKFGLMKPQKVELTIYNIKGEKIISLINSNYIAGNHKITWDGKSSSGQMVSSGIYFYMIKTKEFEKCKKTLLIK